MMELEIVGSEDLVSVIEPLAEENLLCPFQKDIQVLGMYM